MAQVLCGCSYYLHNLSSGLRLLSESVPALLKEKANAVHGTDAQKAEVGCLALPILAGAGCRGKMDCILLKDYQENDTYYPPQDRMWSVNNACKNVNVVAVLFVAKSDATAIHKVKSELETSDCGKGFWLQHCLKVACYYNGSSYELDITSRSEVETEAWVDV
jgi:hypothetical protein